jgi:hypothetical protein
MRKHLHPYRQRKESNKQCREISPVPVYQIMKGGENMRIIRHLG